MEFSLSCLQHLMVISYHCVLLFFSIRFHLRGPPVLHLGEDKDNMEKTLITFIPSFATFACGGSGDLAPRARSKK
jgi:hypothetical protein